MKKSAEAPQPGLMAELLNEIVYVYFPLRAAGDVIAGRFNQTTAEWGLMRSLRLGGPQTVAGLARSRPVARQWIQRLANQLAAEGLIEFFDNPNHRRARLMRLTAAGEKVVDQLAARFVSWAHEIEANYNRRRLATTLEVIRALRDRLTAEYQALRRKAK